MAIVIKPITVEVSKPNLFQAIVAKQNDSNSRYLKVTFVNEGEKITVAKGATVTINAERKDGLSDSFLGETNEDGTITVPLHSWMLELDGVVTCDISILDTENDRKLTSTTFVLAVEKSANVDGNISNAPQYDILIDLIRQVEAIAVSQEYDPTSESAMSGIAVAEAVGDIEVAIDNIIAIQNSLIGGEA